jgi:hypothetical protein
MHPHDMKYIGFKHQRENKQNSDNTSYCLIEVVTKAGLTVLVQ